MFLAWPETPDLVSVCAKCPLVLTHCPLPELARQDTVPSEKRALADIVE